MIRIPQVRVVDEEGAQLGVMPTPQALEMAQERGLDLVEVAPMASPPVVKFLDFGQYKYELTKRDKEAKRKQRSVTFKEVRLKPKIGVGDFDTKVRRAIQFLEEGDRIKVAVQFRGRELTHPEIGRALLARFSDQIKDHGTVERAPLLEGKSMHITVASTHKPKVVEHVSKHPTEIDADTPAPVEATAQAAAASPAPPPAAAPAAAPAEAPAAAAAPAPAAEPDAPRSTAPTTEVEVEAPTAIEAPEPKPTTLPAPTAPAKVAAEPKTPRAKAEPKTRTTAGPAAVAAAGTTPAPRPARTRKTTEPGAAAPATAGE